MTLAEYRKALNIPHYAGIPIPSIKPTKHRNKPVVLNGIRFDSQLEGAYYLKLCHLKDIGDVTYFLRQVPIHLPGGIRYVVDFLVFRKDQAPNYEDVKGRETATFILKKKQVEVLYPIKIECIYKKDIESHWSKSAKAIYENDGLIQRSIK